MHIFPTKLRLDAGDMTPLAARSAPSAAGTTTTFRVAQAAVRGLVRMSDEVISTPMTSAIPSGAETTVAQELLGLSAVPSGDEGS